MSRGWRLGSQISYGRHSSAPAARGERGKRTGQALRRGTADLTNAPITFTTGQPWQNGNKPAETLTGTLTLSGVHDVTIQNITVVSSVTVINSADITINHVTAQHDLDISGTTTAVTVTRSETRGGIAVGSGVSGTVLTDDIAYGLDRAAITVAGAASTDIVNDTINDDGTLSTSCTPAVQVSGGATGTVIENDSITTSCQSAGLVTVAADSTEQSTMGLQ